MLQSPADAWKTDVPSSMLTNSEPYNHDGIELGVQSLNASSKSLNVSSKSLNVSSSLSIVETGDDVPENLLQSYRCEREEAEKKYFSGLIRIVSTFGVLTAVFQIAGNLILGYKSLEYVGVAIATLGELFAMVALLLVSTTCVTDPVNEVVIVLSLDEACRRNPGFSRLFTSSVGLLCLMLAYAAGYPYCRVSAAVPGLIYGCYFKTGQRVLPDTTTTVAICISVLLALASGVQLLINRSPYHGSTAFVNTSIFFTSAGWVTVVLSLIIIFAWLHRRVSLSFAGVWDDPEGSIRAVYIIISSFLTIGIQSAISAPAFYVTPGQMANFYYYGLAFVVYTILPIAFMIVGQKRMSSFLRLLFESSRAKKDGAIVAELLTRYTVPANGSWYIKLANPRLENLNDHEKFWKPGQIIQKSGMQLTVRCKTDSAVVSGTDDSEDIVVELEGQAESSTVLMEQAESNLRCIEWKNIDLKLMTGSIQGSDAVDITQLLALSRPVKRGERVDYFMSHSWKDDPSAKLLALKTVVESFKKKHGRYILFSQLCATD